jgi:L-2-hydroxyglutarate oxidase LhgO
VSAAGPDVEVAVVGAGIVGLAAAAALARSGRSVIILERNHGIARETTSRNSEVVHAGIYYPAGSLKSELCRTGREALYRRCERHGIPYRRVGKLIVATDFAEVAVLERIQATARSNQVPLELLEAEQVERLEPDVRAVAALLSPESGIVDAHAYALSFLAEAEAGGAVLLLGTQVEALEYGPRGWRLRARSGAPGEAAGELQSLECAAVVNAAGLASDRIAELAGLDVDACGYRLYFCKGDYFSLAPGAPLSLSRLVYPVPAGVGLGIHATLDLGGRIRFGPDAEFVSAPSFDVDPAKAGVFARAAARYLPAVGPEWLAPDYAGVRPRLAGPGESFADFVVREESDAGLPGLVSCIGIESPGLTAASAIADRVVELLS